jgi:hypothetical protein
MTGMSQKAQTQEDFRTSFQAAFARLQACIESACAEENWWSNRVAAGVGAALAFAASHPDDAKLLTNDAFAAGLPGAEAQDQMFEHFGDAIRPIRAESSRGDDLPTFVDKCVVSGLTGLIGLRLAAGATASELDALAPEAIQLVLLPYLGNEEAGRIGAIFGGPGQAIEGGSRNGHAARVAN